MDILHRSSSDSPVSRGVALALLTWFVVALLIGLGITEFGGSYPDGPGTPATFSDAFVAIITLDFGTSVLFQVPTAPVVFGALGWTGRLLFATLGVTAALAAGLVALTRYSANGRRVVTVLSYLGALPAIVWLLALLSLDWKTGVDLGVGSPTGGLETFLAGGVALGIPLSAMIGRLVVRDARRLDWVVDSWLFTSWLLGTIVLVEQVLRIEGVGFYLFEGLVNRDWPLVVATTMTLLGLALLASVGRELAWPPEPNSSEPAKPAHEESARVDGGAQTAVVRTTLRENRRLQVGLVGFGALFAVGLVGRFVAHPSTNPAGGTSPLVWTPVVLQKITPSAVLTGVVAAAVGVGLGLLSVRVADRRAIAALALGFAMNVPLYLWYVVIEISAIAPAGIDLFAWPVQVLFGLSIAPLVGIVADRDLSGADTATFDRLLPALGVAAVGAGVAVLVFGYSHGLIGASPRGGLFAPYGGETLGQRIVRLGIGVGFPATSLFLIGDGLREA